MSDLQYALDRMSTALDASRLSGATADEDARCMAIIRAEIDRLTRERDDLRRQLAEAEQRFDWLTERLEDVQIDDVDPNDYYYDGEEDVPLPILWSRAIDAAMGGNDV